MDKFGALWKNKNNIPCPTFVGFYVTKKIYLNAVRDNSNGQRILRLSIGIKERNFLNHR